MISRLFPSVFFFIVTSYIIPLKGDAQSIQKSVVLGLTVDSNTVNWSIATTWDSVLKEAAMSNKGIFIDCYAT
ncbi:MAG: hypothetical protein DI539_23160, partial [Flavobacterium psychrophilum]